MRNVGITNWAMVVVIVFWSNLSYCAVYFNDFETTPGSEWSNTLTDTTPTGNRGFLGQFGNETVTLTLNNLPAHSDITVSFDLFVIRSWDGNDETIYLGEPMGPDIWNLAVQGGPSLLDTTFSNSTGTTPNDYQAYPDSYPGGVYQGFTGADEIKTLGYIHPLGGSIQDAVYNLSFTFSHSESSLSLDFSASNLQSLSDESWGIDNVEIVPEAATLLLLGFGAVIVRRKR